MIEISKDDAQRIAYFLAQYTLLLRQTTYQADGYKADAVQGLSDMLNARCK